MNKIVIDPFCSTTLALVKWFKIWICCYEPLQAGQDGFWSISFWTVLSCTPLYIWCEWMHPFPMNTLFSYLWFSLWLIAIFFTVISHLRFIYFKSDETVFSNDMLVATLLMHLWCFLPFYINSFKVSIFSCSSQWNMSCRQINDERKHLWTLMTSQIQAWYTFLWYMSYLCIF